MNSSLFILFLLASSFFAFGNDHLILQKIELEKLVEGPRSTFFERYGKRMQAKEVSEIVGGMNYDAPAHLITQHGQSNLKDWNERMGSLDHSFYDLHLLYDLNLKATRLWEKMVKCASKGAQSAEFARLRYAKGDDHCAEGNHPYSSKEIKKELKDLHSQVRSYLLTSRILHPKFHLKKGQNLNLQDQPKNREEYNQKNYILPRVHPLLVQVILELFITHYHFSDLYRDVDPLQGNDDQWEDFFRHVQEKGHFFISDIKSQKRENYFSYFLVDFAEPVMVDAQNGLYQIGKKLPQNVVERGIILHNSLFLMSHFPVGFCEDWGLWPGLSLAMSFRLNAYHLYSDNQFYPGILLQYKMLASCGRPPAHVPLELQRLYPSYIGNNPVYLGYHSEKTYEEDALALEDLHREIIDTMREIAGKYL